MVMPAKEGKTATILKIAREDADLIRQLIASSGDKNAPYKDKYELFQDLAKRARKFKKPKNYTSLVQSFKIVLAEDDLEMIRARARELDMSMTDLITLIVRKMVK